MKKVLSVVLILTSFIFWISAQEVGKQVELTMVDGVQLDMALFKKWKDAKNFVKQNEPVAASVLFSYTGGEVEVNDCRKSKDDWILSPAVFNAKTESDAGNLVNKDYKESDNDNAAKILSVLKENECEYGIGFINLGDKLSRYVVAIKGEKLRVNRYNYYKPQNKDYQAYIEKDLSKKVKRVELIKKTAEALIPTPPAGGSVSSEQELYRLRHETQELIYQGSYQKGGTKIFKYRYIYRDDGRIIHEYIVDLDGNIRSNLVGYDTDHDFNKMYPLVEYYSVPKEIRDLAQKSLD